MQEHAIAIARVSGGRQREEDQRPGLVAYAERKSYILDEVVTVHGRSAFHGKHVKYILEAVEKHVRHGGATVVIFRHVDRSSRQGVFEGFDLLKRIMDAGARVEFSEQEYLSQQPGMIGMFFDMAQKESEIKRDRKVQGNTARRARGDLVGRVPWGYDPVLRNDVQVGITPNALGRQWIPVIFGEAVAGASLHFIAERLTLAGIPSPQRNDTWNDASVRRLIANTTYYGAMKNNPNMTFEALVSVNLHKRANVAVEARFRRGRGTVKREPSLVKPYCGACYGEVREGAPSGMSPMYRSGKEPNIYYNCKGIGNLRSSCGAPGIRADLLEVAVDDHMSQDTRPYMVREYVAGDDNDERRAVINEKIRVAQESGDYLLVAQLAQEAMEIGPSKRTGGVELVDSGITIGERWQGLSRAEKREELLKYLVVALTLPQGVVGVMTFTRREEA